MRLVVNSIDKFEVFEKYMNYIDTHPEELERAIGLAVDEYIKDFVCIKDIGLGDDKIFIIPTPENKPIKIVYTENPCPLNCKYRCVNSKLESNNMQIVYRCTPKGYCENLLKDDIDKW